VVVRAIAVLGLSGAAALTVAQSPSSGPRLAAAQGASAAEVINIRQQGFKRLGDSFKLIYKELQGSSPDAAKIAAAAADIKASADVIATWFPAGSGPQSGLKTHAKAEIWSDASGFAATRAAYLRQAEKSVRQLTDPTQRAVWKDTSAALGQACKDCHDSYRVKG
jgi:cytochrome c556